MEKLEISTGLFIEFLIDAKCAAWAGEGRKIRKDDHSRNYYYSKGDFEYKDQYFGNLMDGGREIVNYKKKPIWVMSYHGGMLIEHNEVSTNIFDFLRRALMNSCITFPVRWPDVLTKDKLVYVNSYSGDLLYFSGNETIYQDGEKCYHRAYVGGENPG